jgi:DnaJ-class molecular chaperone
MNNNDEVTCPLCHGGGVVRRQVPLKTHLGTTIAYRLCPRCEGDGVIMAEGGEERTNFPPAARQPPHA